MDVKNIELYKSQIKYYEDMRENNKGLLDANWYKSQIDYLKNKIKKLGGG